MYAGNPRREIARTNEANFRGGQSAPRQIASEWARRRSETIARTDWGKGEREFARMYDANSIRRVHWRGADR